MKNWKKFVIVPSLCLAFGLAGAQTVQSKTLPVVNEASTQESKEDYSKFLEEYKNLSSKLDSLVSEDFLPLFHKRESKVKNFRVLKGEPSHLDLTYSKNNRFGDKDKSYRVLTIQDLFPCDNVITSLGVPTKFHSFYTWEGETYRIIAMCSKPVIQGEYRIGWQNHGLIFLSKDLMSGNYYVDAANSIIIDKDSLESVEKLFDIASKNYKKIESLIQEKE